MKQHLSIFLRALCVAALLSVASVASVQDAPGAPPTTSGGEADPTPAATDRDRAVNLESARRRWERLSPQEQARLRERYEKLQRMGEADRRDLERRRRHLERVERQLIERLDERDRARLAALAPEERERILREMVDDELHIEARRLEEKLPTNWRERLQNATPEDRRRFFDDFKRQVHDEWSPRALERLGNEFGVPREEVEAWKLLPIEQQKRKLLELGKRHRRMSVEKHGLPDGIAPEQWERMEALPPERFFEEAMRLREAGGWEPGRPFFGGPPPGGEDDWSAEARRFRSAGRTLPEDHLEFSHLAPVERREAVELRRRDRLIGALEGSGLVEPAQIEAMRALPHREFWSAARRLNQELSLGLGEGASQRKRGHDGGRRGPADSGGPPQRPEPGVGPPPRRGPRGEGRDGSPPPPPHRANGAERRTPADDDAPRPAPPKQREPRGRGNDSSVKS